MFDLQLQAGIRSVNVKVRSKDGVTRRKCRMVLEREFDTVIAAGLGADARAALLALETGGMESCVLPMDGLEADAQLTAELGEHIEIKGLIGVKAKASKPAGKDGDELPPSIKLEFEFAFDVAAWTFLGQHAGTTAVLLLKRKQLELAGTNVHRLNA